MTEAQKTMADFIPIRRARRGAQAVEFALVIPIILIMGLGIIDYGFYLHQQIDMIEASAAGARIGTSQYWEGRADGGLDHNAAANGANVAADAGCEQTLDDQGRPNAASCSSRVYNLAGVGDSIEVTTTEPYVSIIASIVPIPANTGYVVTSRL